MYGLPGRPLTHEEELILDLNMDRACARLARIAVMAASIEKAGYGPLEYYALDAPDEAAAEKRYAESVARSKVRAHRVGR